MTTSSDRSLSVLIKAKAHDLGFDLCGIASSGILKKHELIIKNWCASGMNGEMKYLGRNIEERINSGLLVPGAKSVIVTGLNYYTDKKQGGEGIPVISRYAYGANYHDVIKNKLNKIIDYTKSICQAADGKSFVDYAPIIEKAWAQQAGLGWPGRHSILINRNIGSFFFLGVIILNIKLDYDKPYTDNHCGTCHLCIDSCPTSAINENRTIDVRRCIAYLTVESKKPVPDNLVGKMEGRIFGCDKCQEVCPWNKKAKPHKNPEFKLSSELELLTAEEWINLSKEKFDNLFKRSPIKRRTYNQFMRNIEMFTRSEI